MEYLIGALVVVAISRIFNHGKRKGQEEVLQGLGLMKDGRVPSPDEGEVKKPMGFDFGLQPAARKHQALDSSPDTQVF